MAVAAKPAEADVLHGAGMNGEGDDWSDVKHSQRTDRPLPRDLVNLLSRKSDAEAFTRMAVHSATITVIGKATHELWFSGGLGGLGGLGWAALGLLMLVQGFLISALGFAMQHECMHLTAFATRRYNLIFGFVCSIPAFSFFEHEVRTPKRPAKSP